MLGRIAHMQYHTHSSLLILLLFLFGCASSQRHPLALTSEEQVPTRTPFDSDGLARATYRMTYSLGYSDTIARLAEMKYFPTGSLASAERNGYVDGVAAAFAAWLDYSKTNVVKPIVK